MQQKIKLWNDLKKFPELKNLSFLKKEGSTCQLACTNWVSLFDKLKKQNIISG
jgi:hypothetical protein